MLKKSLLIILVLSAALAFQLSASAQEADTIFPLAGKLSAQATLMSEPDKSSDAVKTVAFLDVTVTAQSEDSHWYNVELADGTAGWVPTNVVDFVLGEGEAYPRTGKFTSEVMVYSAADTSTDVLARVAFWDVVVLGENADASWYNVQLENGVGGWVEAAKVKFVDASEVVEEAPEPVVYDNIPVFFGGATIYETPDASTVRTLAISGRSGFAPHVAGKNEDGSWLYIYYYDQEWQDGWVPTYQLEIAELRVSRLPVIDPASPPERPSLTRNAAASRPPANPSITTTEETASAG